MQCGRRETEKVGRFDDLPFGEQGLQTIEEGGGADPDARSRQIHLDPDVAIGSTPGPPVRSWAGDGLIQNGDRAHEAGGGEGRWGRSGRHDDPPDRPGGEMGCAPVSPAGVVGPQGRAALPAERADRKTVGRSPSCGPRGSRTPSPSVGHRTPDPSTPERTHGPLPPVSVPNAGTTPPSGGGSGAGRWPARPGTGRAVDRAAAVGRYASSSSRSSSDSSDSSISLTKQL